MRLSELFEQDSKDLLKKVFQIDASSEHLDPAAKLAVQDNIHEKYLKKDFKHLKLWFEKNGFTLYVDGMETNFPDDFKQLLKSKIVIDWKDRHISFKD
jgi:hypothetical protein